MAVKLLTEQYLAFLSLKGGSTGSSGSSCQNDTLLEIACHGSFFSVSLSGAFWMAPEILRSYPLTKASQPGDVYGFAIILYEMCSRNEPYINEHWYQSVEGKSSSKKSCLVFTQIKKSFSSYSYMM